MQPKINKDLKKALLEKTKAAADEARAAAEAESIPSMDDFKDMLNGSLNRIKEGDIVTGTVIGVSEKEVTLDLYSYAEGIIPLAQLSNDPKFSIKSDIKKGDKITAVVTGEDRYGNIYLSCKEATEKLSWDELKEGMKNKTVYSVKVQEATKAGVVAYLKDVRAFIPASKLADSYVEDTTGYVGKTLEVIVITVDKENEKLVLSAKDVLRQKAADEKAARIRSIIPGSIVSGKVETIMPYGAFVSLPDGLSGLLHVSQICDKRIDSPRAVLKEGEEVKVKILNTDNDKISLTMKNLDAVSNDESEGDGGALAGDLANSKDSGNGENSDGNDFEGDHSYSDGEIGTSLGGLFANIKLDN